MTEEKALELEKLHKAIDLINKALGGLEIIEKKVQAAVNFGCSREGTRQAIDPDKFNEFWGDIYNALGFIEKAECRVEFLSKYEGEK